MLGQFFPHMNAARPNFVVNAILPNSALDYVRPCLTPLRHSSLRLTPTHPPSSATCACSRDFPPHPLSFTLVRPPASDLKGRLYPQCTSAALVPRIARAFLFGSNHIEIDLTSSTLTSRNHSFHVLVQIETLAISCYTPIPTASPST